MTNLVTAEFLGIIAHIFLPPLAREAGVSMMPFSSGKSTLSLSIETGSFMGLYQLLVCYKFHEQDDSFRDTW